MDTYQITLGDKPVGKAQVSREGLYYRIQCRCDLAGETVCRILVRCGNREENLGVLVPQDGAFALETRISVKKIGEGTMAFLVVPRHRTPDAGFIPLCPEEPFRYLSRLKDAYLVKRNGQTGIVMKEPGRG